MDKRVGGYVDPVRLTQEQCEAIWQGDGMAAKIVEAMPGEMMRQGYDVKIADDDDGDQAQGVKTKHEELGVEEKFSEALVREEALGSSALFVVANDGQDPAKPLAIDRIRSVWGLNLLTPREFRPLTRYGDVRKPKYKQVETYELIPDYSLGGEGSRTRSVVHESRMIVFPGIRVSERACAGNTNGCGDSRFVRLAHVLRDFNTAMQGVALLGANPAPIVMKIPNLIKLTARGNEAVLQGRLAAIEFVQSLIGMTAIEGGNGAGSIAEEISRLPMNAAGLDRLVELLMLWLAGHANMPATLLMGSSPDGMNATGASDISQWRDRARSRQRTHVAPRLEWLTRIIMLAKDGPTGGVEPEDWSIEFRPLQQMSDKEQAEIRKLHTDADVAAKDAGFISADEARGRYKGGGFALAMQIDESATADMLDVTEEPDPVAPVVVQQVPGEIAE